MAKRKMTRLQFAWRVAQRSAELFGWGVPGIYLAHAFSAGSLWAALDFESLRFWVGLWAWAAVSIAIVGTEEEDYDHF